MKERQPDFIRFLGTAGARIVVSKQLRASGGIWLSLNETNIYIDPGPGALVRCLSAKPKLNPTKLDGIILSHKHLDHSADINVMMEAMSDGGFKKRGVVFLPKDAITDDPVVFKYVRDYVSKIELLKEGETYKIGNISFSTPIKHIHHGTETYGIKFKGQKHIISYITDTKFFPELIKAYAKSDVLIMNILRPEASELDHLCLEDAKKLIIGIKPKVAILTHFGMWMLKAKPWIISENLSKELKTKVIAASDGLMFELEEVK